LERALELLAQPKSSRSKKAEGPPLRELGLHPADNEPVNIYDGKYGPYIKHGKKNVSVPKDELLDDLSLDQAVELLTAKKAAKKKTTTTKTTTTKTTTKTTKKRTTKSE
jgi:DNA topoisomerase-1